MPENLKKTRILLVAPSYPSSRWNIPILPVGLGYLAEQLELNGISYDVYDIVINGEDKLIEKIEDCKPEYIGISLMSLDITHNYSVINKIKNKFSYIKIIAGGPHISFAKEAALFECPSIDIGITNEGEETLLELLNENNFNTGKGLIYKNSEGKIIYNGQRTLINDLDNIDFPKYKKFDMEKYGRIIQIASSRGCPFSCTFCGAFLSMGRKWRKRNVENIIKEICYWYNKGYKEFNFIDSNFFFSKQRIIDLCDALKKEKLDIKMSSDGMRANDADYDMLSKIKKYGLNRIAIGIESANEDILEKIKKGESLKDIDKCMKMLKKLDISVIGFFIIGLPGEKFLHVIKSFLFVLKYPNFSEVFFFNINPLFGTELYVWAKDNKYLKADENQIYENIGGMGDKILIETPELSIKKRLLLYKISKYISKFVRIRNKNYNKIKKINEKMFAIFKKIKKRKDIFVNKIYFLIFRLNEEKKIITHLTDEEKIGLHKLSKNLKTTNPVAVEIGSYLGASSCFIADGIKNKSGKLYCIDTWENNSMSEGEKKTFAEFINNTVKFKNHIEILRGWSHDVINDFKKLDEKIDLLFIDGDHSYKGCKRDWELYSPFLAQNAIVVFHDTEWSEGVCQVIKESVINKSDKILDLPNMQAFKIK
ncbi:radical SAM protein [Candidatus Dependentiae bacterium]|nr:radical SAM protein [Candidatus Dependentiae bacterium]